MKTGGGLYPHHQDKDRPVLPIFIGYRTDLIPPPPLAIVLLFIIHLVSVICPCMMHGSLCDQEWMLYILLFC